MHLAKTSLGLTQELIAFLENQYIVFFDLSACISRKPNVIDRRNGRGEKVTLQLNDAEPEALPDSRLRAG